MEVSVVNDDADFNQIIDQSTRMFVGKAKKKNIKLITHVDQNIRSNFITDS